MRLLITLWLVLIALLGFEWAHFDYLALVVSEVIRFVVFEVGHALDEEGRAAILNSA